MFASNKVQTHLEIEAKFRVDDDRVFPQLLGLTTIGPCRLVPSPATEEQRNRYFDTADGRLQKQRHGLRIRDLGDRRVATPKRDARAHEGLYERDGGEV